MGRWMSEEWTNLTILIVLLNDIYKRYVIVLLYGTNGKYDLICAIELALILKDTLVRSNWNSEKKGFTNKNDLHRRRLMKHCIR